MNKSRESQNEFQASIRQKQFLDVISRDEADARFREHLSFDHIGAEVVGLGDALGRVLTADVISPIDVPAFDRSNVDGFALQSADTAGAMEESPTNHSLNAEVLSPGVAPNIEVAEGTATPIATGGMVPRGADAVVMIEHTDVRTSSAADAETEHNALVVFRSVASGHMVTFAGTDIARGETALRAGQRLTSREIGVIAALGLDSIEVRRRPRVAVISTGNEIVPPGDELPVGCVYDSNAAILSAAIEELGCEPVALGTVRDDVDRLRQIVAEAMNCDAIIMSGGTSKGAGDLSYQVVEELTNPGIVAHGVALKPGKPICLAVTDGKPVVVLPGFPTSAVFTFHEFVAPVLRELAGLKAERFEELTATLPMRLNSDRGRTEYVLVSLVKGANGLTAWPMGKGSGSVTTFSLADGFITIDQHEEYLEAGAQVSVRVIGKGLAPADLVVIGSHCVGLDYLLSELSLQGFESKVLHVGSMGGWNAAKRGECDIAGVHLLDADSGVYNRHLLNDSLTLQTGYERQQGIVFRPGDSRFEGSQLDAAIQTAIDNPDCKMVNRNTGSGTRILLDQLLKDARPDGYNVQTKSHNAVATAVSQSRADWGVAIETVATSYGLGFIPIQAEHYDFLIPVARESRPAVVAFRELLQRPEIQKHLEGLGFQTKNYSPSVGCDKRSK
jgi:putative molybdopterin biosynthesis protein